MLRRIESADNIPDFLERVKEREEKLMGFGHRVYKNYDPRARIIQQHMEEVFEATEYNPLVEIARELEKRALDDEYFTSRKLYPNVDFYSGIIYEALEIPTNMFTVIFAIPRTAGWIAQWMEMQEDPETKIARPRQIYTGEREREYVAARRPRRPGENRRPAGAAAETAAARRLASPHHRRVAAALEADGPARVRRRRTRASTTSTRRWRRCGSGRWRSAREGPAKKVSAAARLRARGPGAGAAAAERAGAAAQAGRRHRRARRRHVRALPRRRRAGGARPERPRDAVRPRARDSGSRGAMSEPRPRSRRAATPPASG